MFGDTDMTGQSGVFVLQSDNSLISMEANTVRRGKRFPTVALAFPGFACWGSN
jgi:hypothetical protein